jgi:predicted MFS family arabinose efflux permease
MGRTLVVIGLVIAGIGFLMMLGLPLGRLPGDFAVRRGNFAFYFPLATSILLSIILTLLLKETGPAVRKET